MWTYQYAWLQYAVVISVDYRCGNGHLIHDKYVTVPYDQKGMVWC